MDFQILIVAVIILVAVFYVGKMMFAKVKSFSAKSSCGNDCGCDSKQSKISKV